MIRAKRFQTNGKCMFLTLFCLLQVTQGAVYYTQATVALCDIKMIRIELFQTNGKCANTIFFCLLKVTHVVVY